jgi:hypothetical protein
MTAAQQSAFAAGSDIQASSFSHDIRLFVGGITLVIAVFILLGLMHWLNSKSPEDKTMFFIGIVTLSLTLMLIFTYCS